MTSVTSWWLLAAAALAVAVLALTPSPPVNAPVATAFDAYANLPPTPPVMSDPEHQATVDRLFQTRSNCWHANRWARVTVPRALEESAAGAVLHPGATGLKTAEGARELAACPPGSWMDVQGARVSVDEVMRGGVGGGLPV